MSLPHLLCLFWDSLISLLLSPLLSVYSILYNHLNLLPFFLLLFEPIWSFLPTHGTTYLIFFPHFPIDFSPKSLVASGFQKSTSRILMSCSSLSSVSYIHSDSILTHWGSHLTVLYVL